MTARALVQSKDELGDLAFSFNSMTDAIMESQQSIAAAHDYVQGVVESLTEAIVVFTPDKRIEKVNKASLNMLGYSEEDLLNKSIDILFEPDRSPLDTDGMAAVMNVGVLNNVEVNFVNKGGGVTPVLFSCSAIRDIDGNMLRIVGAALDITEMKKAEELLQKSREEALAASKAKSEFLANMSHEIRTPMNGVLGMLELLVHSRLSADQARFVDVAHSSANLLLNLLNDILDLSKIEAGKLELESVDFYVLEQVEQIVDLFSTRAKSKGLNLTYDMGNDLPVAVKGDSVRLRQVLVNLVGNAIKFTETGGITIRVDKVWEIDKQVALKFTVSDTGVGISREAQERIFQSFTQADTSTTRRHGGTGLGLTISRQLAELMGGEIGVNSQPGKGSSFWFTVHCDKASLPGSTGEMVSMESQPARSKQDSPCRPFVQESTEQMMWPSARVLVAEDNLVNQEVSKAMLLRYGVSTAMANNGKEAVDVLAQGKYDLVFMDCQMPEMDGYEATRAVREREKTSKGYHIPIVALTAHAMTGDKELCLAAGMDDYLTKPFTQEQLLTVLTRWLGDPKKASQPDSNESELPERAGQGKRGITPERFDRQMLDNLRMIQKKGATDLVEMVVSMFLAHMPESLEDLRNAISSGDAQQVFVSAHNLKSSSAQVGAKRLASLFAEIEIMGHNKAIDGAQEIFSHIELEYVDIQAVLKSELKRTPQQQASA